MLKEIPRDNSFLISKYEVSNQLYNLFLKSKSNTKYASNQRLWITEMDYPTIIENDYTSHPDYSNHPVVNITKEGAQAFCKWLSEEYNKFPKRKYYFSPKEISLNCKTDLIPFSKYKGSKKVLFGSS